MTFPVAFGIGVAQAMALIPGISRSGISISAGLFAGLDREAAARFAFLMATPITAGAALFEARKLASGEAGVSVAVGPLVVGLVAAFVSGMIAISFMLATCAPDRSTSSWSTASSSLRSSSSSGSPGPRSRPRWRS